jgi:hypothetical protein
MMSSAFDIEAGYARGQVVKLRLDGDLNLAEPDLQRALGDIADAGGSTLIIDMFGCEVRQCRSTEPSRVHRGVLQVGTIPRTLSSRPGRSPHPRSRRRRGFPRFDKLSPALDGD